MAEIVLAYTINRGYANYDTAMHLPENIGVKTADEFFQRSANNCFIGIGNDANVFILGLEKQYIVDRKHLDGVANAGGYPFDQFAGSAAQFGFQCIDDIGNIRRSFRLETFANSMACCKRSGLIGFNR